MSSGWFRHFMIIVVL